MTRTMKAGLLGLALSLAGAGQAYAEANHHPPPGCGAEPASNQVLVYTGIKFGGACYCLQLGTTDPWTAYDATAGFPNDAVRSVKTGSGVNLVLFWNDFYTRDNGGTFTVAPNRGITDLGSWNGKASAARVQTFTPNTCDGNPIGPVVMFTDANLSGDCNILALATRCYSDPFEMGFRNDTFSSGFNDSNVYQPNMYFDSHFQKLWATIPPGYFGPFPNDSISSMSGDHGTVCPN
jgi:hypothetical protein